MKNRLNLIVLLLVTTILSCSDKSDESSVINIEETNTQANETLEEILITKSQFESSKMKLGKLSEQVFFERIKTTGEVSVPPENKAAISAYFGGYVKSLSLVEGQTVKKWQTLFTLENPEYVDVQRNFLEIKNQLGYLKSDYERQKVLAKDNVVSQKTFLKAQADYNVAKVSFEALRKKLKLMNIDPDKVSGSNLRSTISVRSPISGFVTKVNISKGMYLNPSDVAVQVINTNNILLELNLYEQDLAKINIGQKVNFKLQNSSNTYTAKIHLINKLIDTKTRQINVVCVLEDESQAGLFAPGMYIEAEILTGSKSGLALPEDAIVNIEESYYVLVLIENENQDFNFEKVEVSIGAKKNGYVEILNEQFSENPPTILIEGAFNLINE